MAALAFAQRVFDHCRVACAQFGGRPYEIEINPENLARIAEQQF
jgi:hypothetical protein